MFAVSKQKAGEAATIFRRHAVSEFAAKRPSKPRLRPSLSIRLGSKSATRIQLVGRSPTQGPAFAAPPGFQYERMPATRFQNRNEVVSRSQRFGGTSKKGSTFRSRRCLFALRAGIRRPALSDTWGAWYGCCRRAVEILRHSQAHKNGCGSDQASSPYRSRKRRRANWNLLVMVYWAYRTPLEIEPRNFNAASRLEFAPRLCQSESVPNPSEPPILREQGIAQ